MSAPSSSAIKTGSELRIPWPISERWHTMVTVPSGPTWMKTFGFSIMSDHGFASWRRAFNLNTWLRDNGYLALRPESRPGGALLADALHVHQLFDLLERPVLLPV